MCRFNPSAIDINSGQLPSGQGTFETVPFIRFRKPLTTTMDPGKAPEELKQANEVQERTVFVVNVAALPGFLQACTLRKWDGFRPWPWESAALQRQPDQ